MKIPISNINNFINNLEPYKNPLLFYGPDEGLVSYRSKRVINSYFANEKNKEINIFDCKEKNLSSLKDSVSSSSLFSKKEVIKIINSGEKLADYFNLLEELAESGEVLVVVHAGELSPRSKLRKHFEKNNNCAVIPCYKTDSLSLKKIIIDFAKNNDLKLEDSSISYLTENLGDNYQIILNELNKLLLLGDKRISHTDVRKSTSSYNSEVFEDMIFNCLENNKGAFIKEFNVNISDISAAMYFLFGIKNICFILNKALSDYSKNNLNDVVEKNMPKYLFRKKIAFSNLVKNKNKGHVVRSMHIISEAEIRIRKNQALYKIFLLRAMLNLSQIMK